MSYYIYNEDGSINEYWAKKELERIEKLRKWNTLRAKTMIVLGVIWVIILLVNL